MKMGALAALVVLVLVLPLHGAMGAAEAAVALEEPSTAAEAIPGAAAAASVVQLAGLSASRRLAQNGSTPAAAPPTPAAPSVGSEGNTSASSNASTTQTQKPVPAPGAKASELKPAAAGSAAPPGVVDKHAPRKPNSTAAAVAKAKATGKPAGAKPAAGAGKTKAAVKNKQTTPPAAKPKGAPAVKPPPVKALRAKNATGSAAAARDAPSTAPAVKPPPAKEPRAENATDSAAAAPDVPSKAAAGSEPAPVSMAGATTAMQAPMPHTAAASAASAAAAAAAAAASAAAAAASAAAAAAAAAAGTMPATPAAPASTGAVAATTATPAVQKAAEERGAALTPVTPVGPDPASTKPYAPLTRRGQQFVFYLQPPYAKYPDCMLPGVTAYFLHWKTPEATVRSVRAAGGYPVCYITIGSWEPNARDAAEFLPGDLGRNFTAYAGQRYLNVRSANVRRLMVKRIEWCYQRGFVGMHFDGTDLYTGDFYPLWKHEQTGHNLTEADMVDYLRYLGQEVHARNMGWGLLNSQMLIKYLADVADWYTNEACFTFMGDCKLYEPVTKVGRPVYQINYTPENWKDACSPKGLAMNFTSILTSRWLHGCPWESCEKKLC